MPETLGTGKTFGVRRFDANEPMDVEGISFTLDTLDLHESGKYQFRVNERLGKSYKFTHFVIFRLVDWPHATGLGAVAPEAQAQPGRYPHRCPMCSQPAYIGLNSIEHESSGESRCQI